MLTTLLLVASLMSPARCEWVEISQRHYRKPLTHEQSHPLLTINKLNQQPTESNDQTHRVTQQEDKGDRYDRHWLQKPESTTALNKFQSDKVAETTLLSETTKPHDAFIRNPGHVQLVKLSTNSKITVHDKPERGFLSEVDKKDVQRVIQKEPSDQPLNQNKNTKEDPSINESLIKPKQKFNHTGNLRNKTKVTSADSETTNRFKPNRIYINQLTTETYKSTANKVPGIATVERVKITSTNRPTTITDTNVNRTPSNYHIKSDINDSTEDTTPPFNPVIAINYPKVDFVTKDEIVTEDNNAKDVEVVDTVAESIESLKEPGGGDENMEANDNLERPMPNENNDRKVETSESVEIKDDLQSSDENKQNNLNEAIVDDGGKSIKNLVKFVEIVADTISKNTQKSFKSKVRYLRELKDSIVGNIEQRLEALYPDDSRRVARAAARAHVDFPSSESALMTISFLTFAVFLIKLVLQVIHTYKNKTMMLTPIVATTVGRAVAAVQRRNNQDNP